MDPEDRGPQPIPDWNDQQEKLLQEWAEVASSYRWLHHKCYMEYKKKNFLYMIPIIIMSTITGTANFAQETFPLVIRPYIPEIIGAINLIAAIITTIYQYLKISEYMESHRLISINYGKFSRNISVELGLPIKDRSFGGKELVKISRLDIDRLIEQSPAIPKHILLSYEDKFSKSGITPPEIITIKKVFIYDDREQKLLNEAISKFKEPISDKNGNNRVGVYPLEFKSSSPVTKFKDSITSELKNLANSKIVSTLAKTLKVSSGSKLKQPNVDGTIIGSIPSTILGTIPSIIPGNESLNNLSSLEQVVIINDSSENSEEFHESETGDDGLLDSPTINDPNNDQNN
jgi:hypothetical protein